MEARIGSWRNNVFAFQATAIIPSEHGYTPALRYGEYGVEAKFHQSLQIHVSVRSLHVSVGLGYRWYHGYPSDQIRQDATLIIRPADRLSLYASSYLDYGVFNGERRLNQSLIWLNPNYRLWKVQVGVCCRLYKQSWISLNYFRHLWGENVGRNGGFIGRVIVAF